MTKEEKREYMRAWNAAHPEKARERALKWQIDNRAKKNENQRKWYAANVEKLRKCQRKQRVANIEKVRESARKYARKQYATSPEKVREYSREWAAANPETGRAAKQRRRARLRDSCSPGVTPEQWLVIVETFDGRCAYCLRKGLPLEREHVIPIKRGGRDEPDNVVPACERCNCSKNASILPLWYARVINEKRI
jgi:5-methylcytosine-specific restriction endonuclease McrA